MKKLFTMTVEDFYDTVFANLKLGDEVFFCLDKKEGSYEVADGSDWMCARRAKLGNEVYSLVYYCGGCSAHSLIVDHAKHADAIDLANCITGCCHSGLKCYPSTDIYVERDVSQIVEEDDGVCFVDRDIFGDDKEHFLHLQFRDGIALGRGLTNGFVVHYPTIDRLTEKDMEDIRCYMGLPCNAIITPRDVCLKYGKLVAL